MMPPEEAFRIDRTLDIVTVHVQGEVDLSNADDLAATVRAASTAGDSPPERIWVDLTEVSFFDSAGINALFALNNDLQAAGCMLGVISPEASPVRRVLDIVQLGRVMPLTESNVSQRD
jgi:anti-anti-sigma factor